MRQFIWAAAAAATIAIAPPALANQPAAVAATVGTPPLVVASVACPRIVRPTCKKYYAAFCTEYGRGAMYKCCAKMTCLPQPR